MGRRVSSRLRYSGQGKPELRSLKLRRSASSWPRCFTIAKCWAKLASTTTQKPAKAARIASTSRGVCERATGPPGRRRHARRKAKKNAISNQGQSVRPARAAQTSHRVIDLPVGFWRVSCTPTKAQSVHAMALIWYSGRWE